MVICVPTPGSGAMRDETWLRGTPAGAPAAAGTVPRMAAAIAAAVMILTERVVTDTSLSFG